MDPKSDSLVQKSVSSSPSDISSPTAVAGKIGIDAHDCLEERIEGKASFFCPSKRKMASEISPRFDSAVKRVKQGEVGILTLRREIDEGETIS